MNTQENAQLKDLITYTKRPELYEKGSAVMWTDPHISRQLLHIHLDPEMDLASRKYTTIKSTSKWILSKASRERMTILDLGCGPGLYSELFTNEGHKVTGVDFSRTSIDYATKEAEKKGLPVTYLHQNYLELDVPDNQFDLATLIYTDLGPLLPAERAQLLTHIHRALKPGGILIFDVLNDKDLESKVSPKSWQAAETGFWREGPHLALSESFFYPDEKVILNQHVVVDESKTEVYRFWTHFFSREDLIELLSPFDFTVLGLFEDVLPEGDRWNGGNVTFCIAKK